MRIESEVLDKLQALKGMNLDIARRIFLENKLDVKSKGFVENPIALCLDMALPKNKLGMDFKELFEVKEIKIKLLKNGQIRTLGDTNISTYMTSEPDFYKSNIWDKSKIVLIVCILDRVIYDIRIFDAEKAFNETETIADKMKNDYDAIKRYKNLCRKNNDILVFKTGFNSIMFKGNTAINLSESIIYDGVDNQIEDQRDYIHEIFDSKFHAYQEKIKTHMEAIALLIEKISLRDCSVLIRMLQKKTKESIVFDMDAGSELSF